MHDHKGPALIQITPLEPQPTIQQVKHAHKPHDHATKFLVGLDVGSTTVKAVVVVKAARRLSRRAERRALRRMLRVRTQRG